MQSPQSGVAYNAPAHEAVHVRAQFLPSQNVSMPGDSTCHSTYTTETSDRHPAKAAVGI